MPPRSLWILVAIALLLRVLACLRQPSSNASLATLPDQAEYLECGRNLLHGAGLSFVDPRFDQRVYAYRMPGYPLLIAGCRGSVTAVRLVQCLLDASTVMAIYLLARRWLPSNSAILAAALVAIDPFQIYFCGLLLSESLFIALLVWGLTLLPLPVPADRAKEQKGSGGKKRVKTNERNSLAADFCAFLSHPPSPLSSVLALLSLCAGVMVRPSATLLPIALTAIIGRWRLIVLALVIESVLLGAWGYRNHRVVGEWIFTTTNSGVSAYDGLNPSATGASDQRFIAEMPQLQAMTETQRNHYLRQLADQFVRQHPLTVCKLAILKLARLWSPIPLSREYGRNLKLIAIALLYSVPLDLLALLGLLFGQIRRRGKLFLLLPAIYFSAVHAVGVGSLRYRIPADVPLTILAASGLAACLGRKMYGQASANA